MLPTARIRGYWLLGSLALVSCQMVSGLGDLEISSDGAGGQASGGGASTGGTVGAGGSPAATCLTGWDMNASCRGQCGDPGDGIDDGCGKFMDCFVQHQCLPATCSDNIDEVCGINQVEGGNPDSLSMAEEVVTCLCYPPPP